MIKLSSILSESTQIDEHNIGFAFANESARDKVMEWMNEKVGSRLAYEAKDATAIVFPTEKNKVDKAKLAEVVKKLYEVIPAHIYHEVTEFNKD